MAVKCKKCLFLKNQWCEMIWDSPHEELERDCGHFKLKTNADRIRAMTDEELAKWIASVSTVCECCANLNDCTSECGYTKTVAGVTEWLKQPAEEVDDG